jgi:cytochrome c-type biogenesis protein CcmH
MALWLILAAMTATAVLAVLWPLRRPAKIYHSGGSIAVYRDQLSEIDRDAATGLIGVAEAESARVEISRRLLAASRADESASLVDDRTAPSWGQRAVTVASLLVLLLGAGALYLSIGSPGIVSAPPARSDISAEHRSIERMVAQVEAYLNVHPDDGRGWEVLAPIYMRYGRYDAAADAWRNALRLLGETAERQANFGEALVIAANDVVGPEARAAFERALSLEPDNASAQFYLGLAAEQSGRIEDAAKMWRHLIGKAPSDAHWAGFVRDALARVEGKSSENKSVAAAKSGPTAEDMEAASRLSPDQQSAMVRGMVDRLAERLKTDGSDLDGWIRLVRAYQVLGETEKARAAVADARRALAGDADKMRQLDRTLKGLGVNG